MKKSILLIIGLTIIFNSCQQNKYDESKSQDHLIMATLWYQRASEMKAIYYQSFNWAKIRVDSEVTKNRSEKLAVVVDIDETMLDNSPFETNCIETGKGYTKETWSEWTIKADAKPVPGAVEFSKYAELKGVEVFYISNRSVDDFDVTLKNLQYENFAFADSAHLLLMADNRSKEPRRKIVREDHEIILLIGDNMLDFSEIFEDRSNNFGFATIDENKDLFGEKFIVLPNPMYGEWEREAFKNKKGLSNEEKYKLRKENLIGYSLN